MLKKALVTIIAIAVLAAIVFGGFTWRAAQGLPAAALEDKYMTPADRFLDIAGARVRLREEGREDAPVILLIHGFTHSLETWDEWAAALSNDFRVVRYDLLGHGLTGPDALERYAPDERAAFVGEILNAIGAERAAIAGNSLGGLAAWRFTAENTARVNALILISPGAFAINGVGAEPARIPAAMKAYLMAVPEAGVRTSAELIYADDTKISLRRLEVMRDMMRRSGNGAAMIKSLQEFTLPDPTSQLARIDAPTLVLWGEDDVLIPIEQGQRIAAIIPGARLASLPSVGHAAQEEAPDETIAIAREFLDDVGAASMSGTP